MIERGFKNEQTGTELARYTVEFDGGATAYIPLNDKAAAKLNAAQLPVVRLNEFQVEEDITIPLSIEQANRLGILDISTVEHIQAFPLVQPNPDWTLWHQLKRLLAHYSRDADAPVVLHHDVLEFWIPPVIHPDVKRLLLMSGVQSKTDFSRTFPDHDIEVIRINPSPWIEGNAVYQIRTGVHSIRTILDYDNTWDVNGFSKMGERILLGICAEIDRAPNVNHAIITYYGVMAQLKDIEEKENVCLLTEFKDLNGLDDAFEAADVVWIIGTPYTEPAVFWLHAQILYGNDEEPLCYESDAKFQYYKDPRIQRIYIQNIEEYLTQILGYAGLNRLPNKKVVLVSSLEIPGITDRPQTVLFDWEDFEIAGSVDKLTDSIKTREQYEKERETITADTSREEIERILGCASRTANSILQKLRGGNIPRVTFREQILSHLADGEKKASELVEGIEGNRKGIHNELSRLTKNGEIIKVRRGVYALPE